MGAASISVSCQSFLLPNGVGSPSLFGDHCRLNYVSNSQRFSINHESIIWLPKPDKTAFVESKNWNDGKPSGNTKLFPNKAGSTLLKPDSTIIELGSPKVNVPVVGGHAVVTILPLSSQAHPKDNLPEDEIKALTKRTVDGGAEVVELKLFWSNFLSMPA